MKYKYYEQVELSEHYYFAEELLEAFSVLLPKNCKATDIHYIIKNYLKDNDMTIRKLYYQTSKGLKRVYPAELALDAITYHVSKINIKIREARKYV